MIFRREPGSSYGRVIIAGEKSSNDLVVFVLLLLSCNAMSYAEKENIVQLVKRSLCPLKGPYEKEVCASQEKRT